MRLLVSVRFDAYIQILKCDNRFMGTEELKEEILDRYVMADKKGEFVNTLETVIDFFDTTWGN